MRVINRYICSVGAPLVQLILGESEWFNVDGWVWQKEKKQFKFCLIMSQIVILFINLEDILFMLL